ncbi:hypothetical protein [Tessaracoccus sp. Y1736]
MSTTAIEHADTAHPEPARTDPVRSLIDPPKGTALAVSYLRVSTREQAEKGGTEEGFSIPAQREANRRKAEQLGAVVVEEFTSCFHDGGWTVVA